MMGSEVHLHANAEGRDVVAIVPILNLSSGSFAPGTEIRLRFDGNVCHLFDNQGENLEF